jgi:hypothetical protein
MLPVPEMLRGNRGFSPMPDFAGFAFPVASGRKVAYTLIPVMISG